jgi:hypothetical protein
LVTENISGPSGGLQARLARGSRIAGYLVEEQVGAGGMAVVFRARDERLGRLAAVKVMTPMLAADEEFRARFERECRMLASVDESHILPVYAAGEANGVLYIATRFVSGGDLASLLRRNRGPLAPERAASLIGQVAAALDAAHAVGLVHRDVKLANVLIDATARGEHAYLADFGLSKPASSATGLTATGVFMGTPDYCSPEQVTGKPPVSARSDQYALACMAFTLLSGTVPYVRENNMATLFAHVEEPVPALAALRPELPTAVDAVMVTAMAKDPADRYDSCSAFADALRASLLAPAPPQAPPPAGPGTVAHDADPRIAAFQPAWAIAADPRVATATAPAPSRPARPVPGKPARSRKTAILAGLAAGVVLVGGGIGVAVALPGSGPTSTRGGVTPTASTSASSAADPKSAARVIAKTTAIHVPGGDGLQDQAFSPDGTLLAGLGVKNTSDIYVFNAATGAHAITLTLPPNTFQLQLAISADDKTLTAIDDSIPGGVWRFSLASGQESTLYSSMAAIPDGADDSSTATISADGSTLAVVDAARDGVVVWNLDGGTEVAQFTDPDGANVVQPGHSLSGAVTLDENGGRVSVADSTGRVYVWNVSTRKVIATLRYDNSGNNATLTNPATLSPDGALIIAEDPASPSGSYIWSVATGANVTPGGAGWPRKSGPVNFSSDGKVIAKDRDNGTGFDLWSVATGWVLAVVDYSAYLPDQQPSLAGIGLEGNELLTVNSSGGAQNEVWHISY